MYSTELHSITHYRDLEALQPQYDQLWATSASRWPFTTWEWLAAWWKYYRDNQHLFVLEVREAGVPVGFVPLAANEGNILAVRRLSLAGTGLIDYTDFLIAAGHEDAVCEAAAAFLAGEMSWDRIQLEQLRWQPSALERFGAPFKNKNHETSVSPGKQTWVASLDESWDKVMTRFSHRWRRHVREVLRDVEKQAPTYFQPQSEAETRQLMTTLIGMREAKETDDPQTIDLSSNRHFKFHSEVVPLLQKKGCVRLFGLNSGTTLVGAAYGFLCGNSFLYYMTGYDHRCSEFRPGTALTIHIMQTLIQEGILLLDFGKGDEGYKQHWLATPHPTTEVTVTAERLSARFHLSMERIARKASQMMQRQRQARQERPAEQEGQEGQKPPEQQAQQEQAKEQ